jgi:cupin fold WbuC family metalloprotein
MLNLDKNSPLVYTARDAVVPLSRAENAFLNKRLHEDKLDRVRICCHKSTTDRLHEMLMAFSKDTYVRPSLHIDKEESLFFIEGFGTYLFFDDRGAITRQVPLGPIGSGRSFYCRVPANTFHALIVESDQILVKETTSGPFSRDDTKFADWAPDGTDKQAVKKYLDSLKSQMRN